MAFKMSYNFEGNHKNKPEQNLSGASKKLTRDDLLQKTHEERRKRQEQRLKIQSANLLQSHIRSYLIRKRMKDQQRLLYDRSKNNTYEDILSKLLFFYDSKLDRIRLYNASQNLLHHHNKILEMFDNQRLSWLIKRWLVICLKNLFDPDIMNLMLNCLTTFTTQSSTIEYLIRKGYFTNLRTLLDTNVDKSNELVDLIFKPLQFQQLLDHSDMVISEFCLNYLRKPLTTNIKTILLPYLKIQKGFPYDELIHYLNSGYHFEISHSLFYCILELEPDEFEPNRDSIQVLANFSCDVQVLASTINLLNDDSDDDDNNIKNNQIIEEELFLNDYLHLLNKPERVRKLLHFFECNSDNDEILSAFIKICHNLLLVYKDSIRKYLLLYRLGLNGHFINKLWHCLNKNKEVQNDLRVSNLINWKECHSTLSVFCDMFTFYTETLTDRENSDTSETFTPYDLYYMCKLLKSVSFDLIELAFPICKSSSITSTPEILHLYTSCLKCVKMLYMLDMRKQFCLSGFWTEKKIHIFQDLLKKNYISKTLKPFYGLVVDSDDDNHLPPLSTMEQRTLAILQELPFLFGFNTRVLLLRDLCRYSLGEDYINLRHEFFGQNLIVIRRTHLYEDAFDKLSTKNGSNIKNKFRIQFINNVGLEEVGIDGGGIFKEFIYEILKTAFDPNRGFFLLTADNTLYPNPNVHLIVDNFIEHYYFIGKLVGKAIFENILVDLPLAEFFLAKLLVDRASAHYLKSLDPVLYRNLLYLRDYPGDVSDLGLDFTTVYNDLGETRIVDLKPNGRNIQVTNENRLEYIQRLADLKLNVQLRRQCTAFRNGLDSVVPIIWLKLFNHNELQVIIGGDTQEIDLSDLRAHTLYGGVFNEDHPTIVLFWKILHKFTDTQRKQLLKFVTSCSRPPLFGFKELNPQFCIQSSGTEDRMPTASTCLNLLKLPIIKKEELLKSKLLSAIEQQAGFELS